MEKYNVYLPIVANNYKPPVFEPEKGIALVTDKISDLDAVGAGWYYTWTSLPTIKEDKRYVPMSYYGLFDESLPLDYSDFVLFLNEPNNPAPFGAWITPNLAAERYIKFIEARPNSKLVVGNTSAWSTQWHYDFLQEIKLYNVPLPKYVGLHGYVESWITPSTLEFYWNQTKLLYKSFDIDATFWITEFADTTGNVENMKSLMRIIYGYDWITRYAYFTNRYDPEAEYIPDGWYNFGLFENDKLSPIGEIYKYTP